MGVYILKSDNKLAVFMKNKVTLKRYYTGVMVLIAVFSLGCHKEKIKGTLEGCIYYSGTTIPVSGATVSGGDGSSTSSSDGHYLIIDIEVGSHNFIATKEGYDSYSFDINIVPDTSTKKVIEMTSSLYTKKIFGVITNPANGFYQGVEVLLLNPDGSNSELKSQTASNGYYQLPSVPQGSRKVAFKSAELYSEIEIFVANYDYPLDFKLNFLSFQKGDGTTIYISPKDLLPSKWGSSGIKTNATSTTDGLLNTSKIISIVGNNHGEGYAAKICDDYVSFGFTDWYLPSKDEINAVITTANNLGLTKEGDSKAYKYGFRNWGVQSYGRYWSSTEIDLENAYYNVGLNGGYVNYTWKEFTYVIRPIRKGN